MQVGPCLTCLCSLAVGAAVRLTGSWEASPAKGQSHELHARQVDVLGPSDAKVGLSRHFFICMTS